VIIHMACPLCGQRVAIAEDVGIDAHGGQTPPGTFAQLAQHSRKVFDESGREWDALCPQGSSPSSRPMLHRP
jgi:hypothetical protein